MANYGQIFVSNTKSVSGFPEFFFTSLLKNQSHAAGENVHRAVDSMTDDVINSVSNGNIYTLKHILMGCGMHSIDGSRQDIDIMHKMNNCCSYDLVRAIETAQAELAIELSKRQFPLPIVPKDEYSSVLIRFWWDNFDVQKENREGSLHTCHGVAYIESSAETVERNENIGIPKSSRRSLDKREVELPEANIIPHKLPPLLNKAKDLDYDNTYASFLPLMWEGPASDMQLKPVRFAPLCCMGCFNIQNSTPRKNTSYVSATNKQSNHTIQHCDRMHLPITKTS